MSAVELAFDEFGLGPPLVVLHGLFGSGRNWQTVARRLAGTYRVFTVDLRNHGRSPHADAMGYEALAADVAALLVRLDLRDVRLLGHSMGGKTAMTLALRDAARIAKLLVVDIAPVAYEDQHTPLIDAMLSLPLPLIKHRNDADVRLRAAVPDPGLRQFLLQNLTPGPDGSRWRLNLPVLRREMDKLVGAVPAAPGAIYPGPVHFLHGGRSDRILDAHMPAISALFPAYRLHTIPNGGHWPHAEAPAEFMAALKDALNDG